MIQLSSFFSWLNIQKGFFCSLCQSTGSFQDFPVKFPDKVFPKLRRLYITSEDYSSVFSPVDGVQLLEGLFLDLTSTNTYDAAQMRYASSFQLNNSARVPIDSLSKQSYWWKSVRLYQNELHTSTVLNFSQWYLARLSLKSWTYSPKSIQISIVKIIYNWKQKSSRCSRFPIIFSILTHLRQTSVKSLRALGMHYLRIPSIIQLMTDFENLTFLSLSTAPHSYLQLYVEYLKVF